MSRRACQKRVNASKRMSIAERCAYGRCMPRLPRRQIPDGLYHVTTRGNRRQPIVLEDRDCEVFLFLLGKVVERLGWKVHAYCLMTNHYHLLVETPNADISVGMQLLNGQYAQAFNRRHGYEGHLFERRFAAEEIESDWHLLEVCRYIVLNPVRAGLCRHPGEWRWSSYRATVGRVRCPRLLTLRLLGMFGSNLVKARAAFDEFVMRGLARPP
jgi:putative transposase